MIHYTMLPQELIYPTNDIESCNQLLIQYNGVPLLVEQTNDQMYQVVRVMSTDPNHYLDASCSPGTKISFFN